MLHSVKLFLIKVIISCCVFHLAAGVSQAAEWNYDTSDPEHGPLAWGNIEGFETCATGMKQSPIDLANPEEKKITELEFDYTASHLSILNNGHTIQVNIDNGSELSIGKKTYKLLQFHFHTPSEHAVDGYRYPMEAHFVHVASDGVLAVVGVFVKEVALNASLAKILENAPRAEGEVDTGITISPLELLGDEDDYLAYLGSLTTPPCSEGVRWHVLEDEIEASHEQLEEFAGLLHHNNARPLQDLNRRKLVASDD